MRLVLASASPRRLELLRQAGIPPDELRIPGIDESIRHGEMPRDYCRRIASTKADSVTLGEGEVILAADTTVAVGRRMLGKPENAVEAERFLRQLSGRRHRVITAVAVRSETRSWLRDVSALLRMKRLTEREIRTYIESGEWDGKAGAYGIQGRAGAFIPWISGSYTAVVGLPLTETLALLKAAGVGSQN